MSITITQNLLTDAWVAEVKQLEAAIRSFVTARMSKSDCRVAFFEVRDDAALHVNVTHKYLTEPVSGWSGPAPVSQGFVHNRTFRDMDWRRVIRHIRDMVFAVQIASS